MTTIAFLGLGRMGTLMAGRVRLAGHDLIVWNRTPERAQPVVAEGARAARKIVLISAALAGVTLTGELLALAEALGVPRDTALDALAAGPLTASVNRIKSTSSDFIIALAAKDLTLATDAADLPQLAAARDWLRTAAAEGAADTDLRKVAGH